MKKAMLITLLFGVVLVGTIGCRMKNLKSGEDGVIDLGENFKINTQETPNCENEIEEFYSKGEQKVYFVCLDKVTLDIDNKKISLKNYLRKYGIKDGIDGIIKKLEIEDALNDGGTAIFRDDGPIKYSDNGITLVKCKTISGNRDIYIGNANLDYYWGFENGFCGK